MKAPTVGDRLIEIRNRLGLLGMLAKIPEDTEGLKEFQPDARAAIVDVIRGAYNELYWLLELREIQNLPAPTDGAQ